MSLILDAGALIAIDRNDRAMWRRLKSALENEDVPLTHGGVVGQVWRGHGPRSARMALALGGIDIRPLDEDLGKRSGELLARARKSDVIDAAVILLATDGDIIATSDSNDLRPLARSAGKAIEFVEV
jgi:hypothetical protein